MKKMIVAAYYWSVQKLRQIVKWVCKLRKETKQN